MATTSQGPTIARRRLSMALRAARSEAGHTQENVAEALDWSVSKMIRIENGKVKASVTDVRALLDLYGVTDTSQVAELIDLARATRQKAWWAGEIRDQLPPAYAEYVALEADASALAFFHPVQLPGLLQTPRYAGEAAKAPGFPAASTDSIAASAEMRRLRQEHLLKGSRRPKIDAIIDQSALLRGSSDLMTDQLLYLLKLGNDPYITLRILPFGPDINTVASPFIIVEFPEGAGADVVYVESASHPELVTSGGIEPFRSIFGRLTEQALPPKASMALIAELAENYEAKRSVIVGSGSARVNGAPPL
jgi:transcriptional regulator with XRE-family HTH domain